jgi:hypothetical protein
MSVIHKQFENSNISVLEEKVCICRGRLIRYINNSYLKTEALTRGNIYIYIHTHLYFKVFHWLTLPVSQ